MSGRRSGVRRNARGGAGLRATLENLIKRITGDNLVGTYLGTDFEFGTPPDVESAPNLARTDTVYTIAEAVDTQRPHAVSRADGEAWNFNGAAEQKLFVLNAASDILDANDDPTFIVIAKVDSVVGGDGVFSLDTGVTNNGLGMHLSGTSLIVTGQMTTGTSTAEPLFTDRTIPHLLRATMRGNAHANPGVIAAIDGVESPLSGRNSPGLQNASDSVYLGKRPTNNLWFSGDIYAVVVIRSYDAAMIASLEALLSSTFNTPALPPAYAIFGAQLKYGASPDDRVMGTFPDIAALTDQVLNTDVTNGTATARPHLIYLNDILFAENLIGKRLTAASASNIWDSGETEINAWMVARIDPESTNSGLFSFSLGTAVSTGLNLYKTSASNLRVVVHAGGTSTNLNVAFTSDQLHMFRVHYDGTNITLYVDGVSVGSVAKTGTMTNDCTRVNLGARAAGGQTFDGDYRSCYLVTGALVAQQITDMDAFVLADAGLTPSVDDGVDILAANGVFGTLASDRAMEAADPDTAVLTLLDRYHNCSPTQATPSLQPNLTTIGGVTYTNHVAQYLFADATVNLWEIAQVEVNLWCVARTSSAGTTEEMMAVADGGATVGLRLVQTSDGKMNAIVNAGAVITTLSITVDATVLHMYRIHYDGVNITFYVDGIQAGQLAKTGTMTAAGSRVVIGAGLSGGSSLNGDVRSGWVATGTLTGTQITNMDAYVMADAGL